MVETVAPYPDIVALVKGAGGEAYKYCYQCGKCDVVCPWNRVRRFSMRKLIREASLGLTEIERDEMWLCTTCGHCPAECPRGVRQIEVGVSLRRVAAGFGAYPARARPAGTAAANLRADGNPMGETRERRADWAAGLGVRPFTEGMELCYFVGCYYSYDPRLRKAAVATARILERAGVEFGILGDQESCCGESIRKTGREDDFKALARANIKAFIDRGVKKILVASPHCYEAFRRDYAELMVRFEVVHLSECLRALIDAGRLLLGGRYEHTVAYHDPCYLGRHNGIYEAPRAVLRSVPGLRLVELRDNRAGSLCCGGGGGGIWMETPKGERFANLRVEQARAAGAEVLCTSCPYCVSNFEESRLTLGCEEALAVKDLSEIVVEALGEGTAGAGDGANER
jgi:Fe-S oxidoreductase